MATYYIFFRAWLDLSDDFPYDRFNSIPDDRVMCEVHRFCRDILKNDDALVEIAKRRLIRARADQAISKKPPVEISTIEDTFGDDWTLSCYVLQHKDWMRFWKEPKFFLPLMPQSLMSRRVFMDAVDSQSDSNRLINVANGLHPEWRLRFGVFPSANLRPEEIDLIETWIDRFCGGPESDDERGMREHAIDLMNAARSTVLNGSTPKVKADREESVVAPRKKQWTKQTVTEAVWKYKSDRSAQYERYKEGISTASDEKMRKKIQQKARAIFGRNAIARNLGANSSMITPTPGWKQICADLCFETTKKPTRVGIDKAFASVAEKKHRDKDRQERAALSEDEKNRMQSRLRGASQKEIDNQANNLLKDR